MLLSAAHKVNGESRATGYAQAPCVAGTPVRGSPPPQLPSPVGGKRRVIAEPLYQRVERCPGSALGRARASEESVEITTDTPNTRAGLERRRGPLCGARRTESPALTTRERSPEDTGGRTRRMRM
ncbi:unnamed protein product [Boreogadus saida]